MGRLVVLKSTFRFVTARTLKCSDHFMSRPNSISIVLADRWSYWRHWLSLSPLELPALLPFRLPTSCTPRVPMSRMNRLRLATYSHTMLGSENLTYSPSYLLPRNNEALCFQA